MNINLITKAKEILIAVWESNGTSYPTSGRSLDRVIADTLSITQEDPEEQTHTFETSDNPETTYTAGAYKVDLNNARLDKYFMTQVMGWKEVTSPKKGVVAPKSYENRYVALQVKFADDDYFFLPKISIAPKLVMESIKTNLVYGTLSGTATDALVGDEETPYGRYEEPILTKATDTDEE